jgi:hypothetical protein
MQPTSDSRRNNPGTFFKIQWYRSKLHQRTNHIRVRSSIRMRTRSCSTHCGGGGGGCGSGFHRGCSNKNGITESIGIIHVGGRYLRLETIFRGMTWR